MLRIGINRALWIFGLIQLSSILGFAILATTGAHFYMWGDLDVVLFGVVSFEYLGVGLGTSAFVAFLARATDKRYTATQFALLSSIMALPRTFTHASAGYLIEGFGKNHPLTSFFGSPALLQNGLGYPKFFLFCTALAIPGMLLLFWVAPWSPRDKPHPE